MEIFELRYFLAVAKGESLNRAAGEIHASPAALSKAISRLEEELQTPLFFKAGRGIRLTPEGQLLKKRASQILQLEEDARLELKGKEAGSLNVYVSSEEVLQTSFGLHLAKVIDVSFPKARTQFLIRNEAKAVEQVATGEAHFALTTADPPKGLAAKVLAEVKFRVCAGRAHPILKRYRASQGIPVDELLRHAFVAPDSALLGRIENSASIDGWRDDKFPRIVKYKVCGLKLMENIVREGMALAYLPDYFVESAGLVPLKVTGCPYSCRQTVRLVTKDPAALGWLNKLWHEI